MNAERAVPRRQDPFDRDLMLHQFAGMEHMLPELLTAYRESAGECLDVTRRALLAGETDEAWRAAHTLKGMSAAVCATLVRDQAQMLELAARAGDLPGAMAALPGLESLVERAVAAACFRSASP
jgi:HPt (histidine-containing phosphotransfer) domain-containing protein